MASNEDGSPDYDGSDDRVPLLQDETDDENVVAGAVEVVEADVEPEMGGSPQSPGLTMAIDRQEPVFTVMFPDYDNVTRRRRIAEEDQIVIVSEDVELPTELEIRPEATNRLSEGNLPNMAELVTDINEEAIFYFRFNDEYTDLCLDDNNQIYESPQDDFLNPLPPKPALQYRRFSSDDSEQCQGQSLDFEELAPSELNPAFRKNGTRMSFSLKDSKRDLDEIRRHIKKPRYGIPVGKLPFGTPDVVDMDSYTSLNYATSSCEYKIKHDTELISRGHSVRPPSWGQTLVTLLIGLTVGGMGATLGWLIELLSKPKYDLIASILKTMGDCGVGFVRGAVFLCLINMGFVLVSCIFGYIEPVSTGSGIPHIKTFLNGVKTPRLMHLSTLICKFGGVIFSVVGGMPVGKEGPMIHSGAIIGAGISQGKSTTTFLKYLPPWPCFETFRNDVTKREFVAVGSAAGVAAAFGAPLGGVLFVIEEGGSFLDVPMIFLCFIGAVASQLSLNLFRTLITGQFGNLSSQGLLSFGSFMGKTPIYTLLDILLFFSVGIVCGWLGALFNFINKKITQFRMQNYKIKWTKYLDVLGVSSFVTAMAVISMFLIRDCRPLPKVHNQDHLLQLYCPDGQYHSGASIWFATPEDVIKELLHDPTDSFTFSNLSVFTVVYYVLSVITYGLPISSGLFIPCLLIGAGFGRLVGMLCMFLFPTYHWDLGLYALVGASGMLTGVVRIAVCIVAILTEATGNHMYAFPILITVIAAKLSGDSFNEEGIYEIHNNMAGVSYLQWVPCYGAQVLRAKHLMSFPVRCLEVREKVSDVYHFVMSYPHHGIPIVDHRKPFISPEIPCDDGHLLGFVLKEDILTMLQLKMYQYEGQPGPDDPPLPSLDEFNWKSFRQPYPHYFRPGEIEVDPSIRDKTIIDFTNIMDPSPPTTKMNSTMQSVFENFRARGLRHMIVIDDDLQVKGMITRKDLYTYTCHEAGKIYGSRQSFLAKKTQVVKSENYWIVVRKY